jgi:hypothetical protein
MGWVARKTVCFSLLPYPNHNRPTSLFTWAHLALSLPQLGCFYRSQRSLVAAQVAADLRQNGKARAAKSRTQTGGLKLENLSCAYMGLLPVDVRFDLVAPRCKSGRFCLSMPPARAAGASGRTLRGIPCQFPGLTASTGVGVAVFNRSRDASTLCQRSGSFLVSKGRVRSA